MSEHASTPGSGTTGPWDRPRRRYLALWLPFLPTERVRRGAPPDERPLVLVERVGGALRLHAVCRRSARLGLGPGMTLADAEARHPGLDARAADPAADAAFLSRLADRADRWTPMVMILPRLDASADLVLDVTGAAHLFGGEAALCEAAREDLRRLGVSCRAALAGSPDLAVALARHDGRAGVEGDEAGEARRLPVEALRLPSAAPVPREAVAALRRAGLRTVGEVACRSRGALAARFGAGLVRQLDRLLGIEDARIVPRRPLPPVLAERRFAEPLIGAEALSRALAPLLAEACGTMEARGTGARAVEAALFRTDGRRARLDARTGRPVRDPALLLRLLAERLERIADPDDAGVGFEAARVSVRVEAPMRPVQPGLGGERDEGETVGDLLDRLSARLGEAQVLAFRPSDTHDPDRETRLVPATRRGAASGPWPAPEPGGPPLRFRWRRALHEVVRAEGPERIEPLWWRAEPHARARDYYRVEDAGGRRFWVFREGLWGEEGPPPRWFLHGLFA